MHIVMCWLAVVLKLVSAMSLPYRGCITLLHLCDGMCVGCSDASCSGEFPLLKLYVALCTVPEAGCTASFYKSSAEFHAVNSHRK